MPEYIRCSNCFRQIPETQSVFYAGEEPFCRRCCPEEEYIWIRKWGQMMGSYQYYINNQKAEAKEDNAPQNAIHKSDGVWMTTDDITNKNTRITLNLPLLED